MKTNFKALKKILSIALATMMIATLFAGCGTDGGTDGGTNNSGKVTIEKSEDLNGKKIGVQAGTTGETWVTENATGSKVSSFKSGMDAALDLKNGAIDAVVLDELPAKAIVEQNPDLMILDLKFAKEEYAIAVKKGNKDLLDSINKTIDTMKENGEYEALVNAFMPTDGAIKIPENVGAEGATKEIKLGTNAAFKPFEYVEGKDIVGFDISMGNKIAADMGATLKVENMEFDSLISALSSGAIDFVAAGMSVTSEREKNVDFSKPYFESEQVVIVKK